MLEVIRKKRYSKGWLVYIKTATSCCNQTRKVLEFGQENEPNEEEINKEYESRIKGNRKKD